MSLEFKLLRSFCNVAKLIIYFYLHWCEDPVDYWTQQLQQQMPRQQEHNLTYKKKINLDLNQLGILNGGC